MRKQNRVRGSRERRSPLVATERDRGILLLVGLCGYVATDQIAREFFPSDDRARRRIRQLFDAGLLCVTLASSTQPNLLSLSKEGLRVVAEAFPHVVPEGQWEAGNCPMRLPGAIRLAGVAHHLAVVDARLYLAALARAKGGRIVAWEGGAGALAGELGLRAQRLQPDGIAELDVGGRQVCVAVEVDMGTEPSQVLAGKLERYAATWTMQTGPDQVWLVVCSEERRGQHLHDLVESAGVSDRVLVLGHDQTVLRPVVAPLASRAGTHGPKGPNTLSGNMQEDE